MGTGSLPCICTNRTSLRSRLNPSVELGLASKVWPLRMTCGEFPEPYNVGRVAARDPPTTGSSKRMGFIVNGDKWHSGMFTYVGKVRAGTS